MAAYLLTVKSVLEEVAAGRRVIISRADADRLLAAAQDDDLTELRQRIRSCDIYVEDR